MGCADTTKEVRGTLSTYSGSLSNLAELVVITGADPVNDRSPCPGVSETLYVPREITGGEPIYINNPCPGVNAVPLMMTGVEPVNTNDPAPGVSETPAPLIVMEGTAPVNNNEPGRSLSTKGRTSSTRGGPNRRSSSSERTDTRPQRLVWAVLLVHFWGHR